MPQGCVQQSTVSFGSGLVEIHSLAHTFKLRRESFAETK